MACEAVGQEVLFSDLVSSGFDPVERRAHYTALDDDVAEDLPFDPLKFQDTAARRNRIPSDVAAEIAKLRAVERLILQFPFWWFGPPAILKGWFDRCLVHGALHTSSRRFDTGLCGGKKALF